MKTILVLVLGLVAVTDAEACGRLSLRGGGISDQWSRRSELQDEILEIVRSDTSKACSYFITFTSGQGHNQERRVLKHGSTELSYQLYQSAYRNESQILKALPGVLQSSHVVMGSFRERGPSSERKTYFYGLVPDSNPLNFPVSGHYGDSFTISIYQGTLGQASKPDDTLNVQVRLEVPRMIALSLVSTGDSFRLGDTTESMDFGMLKTGDSKDFDLRVISNAGYKVTFSSANNGSLRHTHKEISTDVSYRLSVDSNLKNLTGSRGKPITVANGSFRGETQAVRKNVRVTIGDVQDKMAGKYQDVITIVATAVE